MSQKYFTTLTNIGAALHANAQLQQTTVPWTHLVLGDGNGVEPVPNPSQTGVLREVDRLAISSIEPDPDNPNWIVIEAVIPADRGGYVVRETALMGTAGGNQCIAVGNYPSATKPLLSEGAGSELVIRVVVEIAHTATVTLKIDPAVVIASRDWVEKQHATQQKRGLVRLATIPEVRLGEAVDIAVTPAGVMHLVSEISADSGMVVISTVGVTNWEVPEVLRSGKKKLRLLGVGAGQGGRGGAVSSTVASVGGYGGSGVIALIDLTGVQSIPITVAAGTIGVVEGSAANPGSSSFGVFCTLSGAAGLSVGGGVISYFARPGGGGQYQYMATATGVHGGSGGDSLLGSGGVGTGAGASGNGGPGAGGGAGVPSAGNGGPAKFILEW